MPTIFREPLIQKIREGRKTQTRRTSKRRYKVDRRYGIRSSRFRRSEAHIVIKRRFEQKLGEISSEDIKKEGFDSLEEFRKAWEEINGKGSWDTEQIVTVYEFRLVRPNSELYSNRYS